MATIDARTITRLRAAAAAPPAAWLRIALPTATFVLTALARTWHINRHFWMLGDQIRDWGIALGPFTSLPLVGPATHVGGYTIGPAFYWILWAIRVVVGPWFDNLPHSGGIGQALLYSGGDALLLMALWKRTGSPWLAISAVVVLATAPFDLVLSAVIWNPVIGPILARTATALILLGWHRRSLAHTAITAAIAWSAVHSYTGAVFVALGVFAALVADEIFRRNWRAAAARAGVVVAVVAALQVPYLLHQAARRFSEPAMGAVTGSIGGIVTGRNPLRLEASADVFTQAVAAIELSPWSIAAVGWILLVCAAVVTVRYRDDPVLLAVTVLPQLAAVAGYAVWAGDLQFYYYLSLMPAVVITILVALTTIVPARAARVAAVAVCLAAILAVPARLRFASTLPMRLPAYEILVRASRQIARRQQPMQSIRAQFPLPPTADSEFIFRILGGRIDRQAEWRALVAPDGHVTYSR
jgi:hypothetical protein